MDCWSGKTSLKLKMWMKTTSNQTMMMTLKTDKINGLLLIKANPI